MLAVSGAGVAKVVSAVVPTVVCSVVCAGTTVAGFCVLVVALVVFGLAVVVTRLAALVCVCRDVSVLLTVFGIPLPPYLICIDVRKRICSAVAL